MIRRFRVRVEEWNACKQAGRHADGQAGKRKTKANGSKIKKSIKPRQTPKQNTRPKANTRARAPYNH